MASIVSAGTTSATALNMSADTTGILQLASNNGTVGLTMDTSQNVGIGTSSPGSKLQVSGTTGFVGAGYYQVSGGSGVYGTNTNFYSGGGDIALAIGTNSAGYVYQSVTTNHALAFGTNNTERMRINAGAPILCLSGGSTTATGTGIAFPATQSASTDANTLDDYEEGSWTPTDGSGAGLSFTINSATYTKIGNMVRVSFYGSYPSTANTNQASISGLPFTASNYGSASIVSSSSAQSALVRMIQTQTKLDIKALVSDTSVTNVQLSTHFLIFTLVYIV
jgi:hypothetical protein